MTDPVRASCVRCGTFVWGTPESFARDLPVCPICGLPMQVGISVLDVTYRATPRYRQWNTPSWRVAELRGAGDYEISLMDGGRPCCIMRVGRHLLDDFEHMMEGILRGYYFNVRYWETSAMCFTQSRGMLEIESRGTDDAQGSLATPKNKLAELCLIIDRILYPRPNERAWPKPKHEYTEVAE